MLSALHANASDDACLMCGSVYEFLVRELPEEQRADNKLLTKTSISAWMNMEGMSPIQLAAKRGLRRMFQVHICLALRQSQQMPDEGYDCLTAWCSHNGLTA